MNPQIPQISQKKALKKGQSPMASVTGVFIAGGKMVLSLDEITGNIWMAQFEGQK